MNYRDLHWFIDRNNRSQSIKYCIERTFGVDLEMDASQSINHPTFTSNASIETVEIDEFAPECKIVFRNDSLFNHKYKILTINFSFFSSLLAHTDRIVMFDNGNVTMLVEMRLPTSNRNKLTVTITTTATKFVTDCSTVTLDDLATNERSIYDRSSVIASGCVGWMHRTTSLLYNNYKNTFFLKCGVTITRENQFIHGDGLVLQSDPKDEKTFVRRSRTSLILLSRGGNGSGVSTTITEFSTTGEITAYLRSNARQRALRSSRAKLYELLNFAVREGY